MEILATIPEIFVVYLGDELVDFISRADIEEISTESGSFEIEEYNGPFFPGYTFVIED